MSSNIRKNVMTSMTCSGSVINTNGVKWSENNCIAIIIKRGIYVFESHFNPNEWTQEFPYHKTVIENPNETMNLDSGLDVTDILSSGTLDEQHLLMLDQTLIPNTANKDCFTSFRSVEWSPICGRYGCLLTALTLDHRLIIYKRVRTGWESAVDLSVLLNNQMKQYWDSNDSINYSTYRQRIYSLATVAFCWAQKWDHSFDGSEKSCALYLGSKNGFITIWKITVNHSISAQFLYKWRTGFDQINCLKSFEHFLLISSFSGMVSVIHSAFSLEESPNPLSLWLETDEIGVNQFAAKRIDEQTFDVMFTKSVFLVLCRITAEAVSDSITMNLKYCKTVEGLHRMPSTGLCSSVDSKYLLTSTDGRLIEIEVFPDLSLTQSEVALEGINSSSMCAYGIDSSPNGCLSALVQTIVLFHDHLVIKESIQIIVFSNQSFDELFINFSQKYLSETPIRSDAEITECFDYLDCFRAFLNSNSLNDSFLIDFITNEDLIMNCEDLLKLKLIRFLSKTFVFNCKTKISENIIFSLNTKALIIEDMILRIIVQNLSKSLISSSKPISDLNNNKIISLKNMNSWLSKRFGKELFDKKDFNFDKYSELCPICEKEIRFENRNCDSCEDNHQLIRCTNSLVLCDIKNNRYEKCIRCDYSLIIKPSVWEQYSNQICFYCQ